MAATGQGTLPNRSLQESSPYAARYAVKQTGTIGRSRILRVLSLQFLVDLSWQEAAGLRVEGNRLKWSPRLDLGKTSAAIGVAAEYRVSD